MADTIWLDRMIAAIAPGWQLSRERSRAEARYMRQAERVLMSYGDAISTRLTPSWGQSFSATGIRDLAGGNLRKLRDRSRELDRNNYLAGTMLDAATDFIIGNGTKIEATTPDKEWNAIAEEKWGEFWRDPEVRGIWDGVELERMVYRTRLMDGDVGLLMLNDGKLQMITGDWIETPLGDKSDRFIVDGVQITPYSRATAFWIKTTNQGKSDFNRVDARDFIWLPRIIRGDQVRGEPVMNGVFSIFDQLVGTLEAVVIAYRMAAMFGVIHKTDRNQLAGLVRAKTADGGTKPKMTLEPGFWKEIGASDEIVQIKPEQPSQQLDMLVSMLSRFAGLKLGLPLEIVLKDFTKINYSGARANLKVAERGARPRHSSFAEKFISRVYRWKISKWIKDGELPEPVGGKPWDHMAIQDPHQYLDPSVEAKAEAQQLLNGTTTQTWLLHEKGRDLSDWISAKVAEREEKEENGITDPGRADSSDHEEQQNEQTEEE